MKAASRSDELIDCTSSILNGIRVHGGFRIIPAVINTMFWRTHSCSAVVVTLLNKFSF